MDKRWRCACEFWWRLVVVFLYVKLFFLQPQLSLLDCAAKNQIDIYLQTVYFYSVLFFTFHDRQCCCCCCFNCSNTRNATRWQYRTANTWLFCLRDLPVTLQSVSNWTFYTVVYYSVLKLSLFWACTSRKYKKMLTMGEKKTYYTTVIHCALFTSVEF